MKSLGISRNGIFAEYAAIRDKNIWHNDESIKPEIASLQDPLGNAVQTVFAGNVAGKTVLITGAGPIGLMAVSVAKATGAGKIIVTEHANSYRLDIAKRLGADHTLLDNEDIVERVKELTDGNGVDVSLEFSGAMQALRTGLKSLTNGGKMVILGLYSSDIPFSDEDINDIVIRGISVEGITGRLIWDTWYQSNRLLKSGKLKLDELITDRFKFDDFHDGFRAALSGKAGKIIYSFD